METGNTNTDPNAYNSDVVVNKIHTIATTLGTIIVVLGGTFGAQAATITPKLEAFAVAALGLYGAVHSLILSNKHHAQTGTATASAPTVVPPATTAPPK
jgi:hypothetical protein